MSKLELDTNHLSEDELDVEEVEVKNVKSKQSSVELFDEFTQMMTAFDTLDSSFSEKEKLFEKEKKEYTTNRKKAMKDIELLMKKFGKSFKVDISKTSKTRKTGNSGKAGFNKKCPVPQKLREYIGLEEDALLSRPEVTRLLNNKFKAEKFRSEDNGKVVKITSKKAAKLLGCEHNLEIEFNKFQGFISKFYNDEKQPVLNV